jgi:integrase
MPRGSVRRRHSGGCPAAGESGRCRCRAGWQVRFYDVLGRRHERGGFETRRAAEAALQRLLAESERGPLAALRPIGFTAFAERWLETYARPNVKPATFAAYAGAVRNHLAPYFGDVPLGALTREHVERYLADKLAARKTDGRPQWSPKTIHNTFVPLREMLEHAIDWGYLAANPAARVRPVRREHSERDILAPEELRRVLDAAEGTQWRLMFLTAALTGLRRGELLGLRWGDTELEGQRLHVRQTFGRYGFGSPKSRAGRRAVPLTPALVAELRRHRLAQAPNDRDLVFASEAGTPIDPDNVNRAWERTLRRAGIRHMGFHALRHTAVSLLIAHEGLNPKQLTAVIGHASIQLTYDTYGHLMPDAFDGFGRALDALAAGGDAASAWGHSGVTGPSSQSQRPA